MTKINTKTLVSHPIWEATNPHNMRLVRLSEPFPKALNPFAKDGVIIRAAGVPGESPHSKWYMAREGILDGVQSGAIVQGTQVFEGTSGNTGHGEAFFCNALGIHFTPIMGGDVPSTKIDAIRVIGPYVHPETHSDPVESPTARARRLGAEKGCYCPDQYSERDWNRRAHYTYMAPQLFGQMRRSGGNKGKLLFAAGGTMGTNNALHDYAVDGGWDTIVVPVLCDEKPGKKPEEVPGARTMTKVVRDVRNDWRRRFPLELIQFGSRHESFLLSYLSWRYVPQMLGPSFGLGLEGAFRFIAKHKRASTLDQFRNEDDGSIPIVVFGADDYRPYIALYFGELSADELAGTLRAPLLEHLGIES